MSRLAIKVAEHTFQVELSLPSGSFDTLVILVDGEALDVQFPAPDDPQINLDWLIVDNRPLETNLDADFRWIRSPLGTFNLEIQNLDLSHARAMPGESRIKAPIAGQITQVLVTQGDPVQVGQLLLVLEAMKMENEIRAHAAGRVSAVYIAPGEKVAQEQLLVMLEDGSD